MSKKKLSDTAAIIDRLKHHLNTLARYLPSTTEEVRKIQTFFKCYEFMTNSQPLHFLLLNSSLIALEFIAFLKFAQATESLNHYYF